MIKSIRHKALGHYHSKGVSKGLNADHLRRIRLFLDQLDTISSPKEMDFPGSGFHLLIGDRKGQYSLTINRNWRMVFEWDGDNVVNVDLVDYH